MMQRISAIVILLIVAGAAVLGATFFSATAVQRKGQIMNEQTEPALLIEGPNITVVFDNNPYKQGLQTDWGFSALVEGPERTILFDTGGDGSILLANMEKLDIKPANIDTVVLSHIHGDHTGGLASFLEKNPQVTVYLLKTFPSKFKDDVRSSGAEIVEVEQSVAICKGVYSTGRLGLLIKEQSLIIRTGKGMIVITGCAHPGIVEIVNRAKELLGDDILLVMGGFHLEWARKGKIEKIISAFKQLNVRYAAPCHCSGNRARDLFREHFGDNYINVGAGSKISYTDLK